MEFGIILFVEFKRQFKIRGLSFALNSKIA